MTENQTLVGVIEDVAVKPNPDPMGKWKNRSTIRMGGKTFASFDENVAKDIIEGRLRKGIAVEVTYYTQGTFNNILSILPAIGQVKENLESNQNTDKPDWKAISRGKVRHGVVTAFIQNSGLQPLTDDILNRIEEYVEYVMEGRQFKEMSEIKEETW